jgi:CRISPR/Cas system-associated protein endoribonuclease Cas2
MKNKYILKKIVKTVALFDLKTEINNGRKTENFHKHMEIKHAYYSIKQTSDQRILKNSNEFKVF